jgi:7-cyano-7-deazaguanine synthase
MMLLLPASLWCHRHDVHTIALGSLRGNPFGDSGSRFDTLWTSLVHESIQRDLRIVRPFAELSKRDVRQMGRDLPLHLTLSCIAPRNGKPCGACNKCAENAKALS